MSRLSCVGVRKDRINLRATFIACILIISFQSKELCMVKLNQVLYCRGLRRMHRDREGTPLQEWLPLSPSQSASK